MTQVLVIAIAAFNALAVYFLSFLAAGGDGSSGGVVTVRWFGFGAIAIATAFALTMCARGKLAAGIATAVGTLPVAYALSMVTLVAGALFDTVAPAPNAFLAACKDMGAQYLRSPVKPVRSIAYDWKTSDHPPQINYFEVGSNGHLSSLRGGLGLSRLPAQIEFTEGRCCRFEGSPTTGAGLPYIRRPNSDAPYFGIGELSADVLVMFSSSPAELKEEDLSLRRYDVQVTDRRTGDTLATLKYMIDMRRRRGCGSTSDGVMDERAFVLKAIGVQ
jgi:hypothetical protein